jgi:hypothetical protein
LPSFTALYRGSFSNHLEAILAADNGKASMRSRMSIIDIEESVTREAGKLPW